MIFRLSGPVSETGERTGVAKASGKPYSIPWLRVSLGAFAHTEVTLADSLVGRFGSGDDVDLVVEVEASGGFLRARALCDWPDEDAPRLHAAI